MYISGNIDDYIMFLRSTRLIVADETLNSWTELTVTHLALIESSETIRTCTIKSSFCVHTGSILITPSKSQWAFIHIWLKKSHNAMQRHWCQVMDGWACTMKLSEKWITQFFFRKAAWILGRKTWVNKEVLCCAEPYP